ncbi:MAG: hypothetical protein FJ037_06710 [Chloroflexi bacterium]|nr:hypothetical protein [Chloroflexota bacterium]
MTTFRVSELTLPQVRTAVRAALADGLDAERVASFLASVDWGGEAGAPEVRELLGELEMALTEYGEGDLKREAFEQRLRDTID